MRIPPLTTPGMVTTAHPTATATRWMVTTATEAQHGLPEHASRQWAGDTPSSSPPSAWPSFRRTLRRHLVGHQRAMHSSGMKWRTGRDRECEMCGGALTKNNVGEQALAQVVDGEVKEVQDCPMGHTPDTGGTACVRGGRGVRGGGQGKRQGQNSRRRLVGRGTTTAQQGLTHAHPARTFWGVEPSPVAWHWWTGTPR
jgi:hypothetical protein